MKSLLNNQTKLYINAIFRNFILLTLSGSLLQAFLLENGMEEAHLTSLTSVLQLIQTATILSFSTVSDKVKRVIPMTAFVFLLCVPVSIYFIVVTMMPEVEINLTLFFVFSALYSLFSGVYTVIAIKMQYLVIERSAFGKFMSIANLICGIVGTACSSVISALQLIYPFNSVMRWAYILTIISVLSTITLILSLKPIRSASDEPKEEGRSLSLFKYRPFIHLIAPNLIRGFGSGIVGYSVTVGYYTGILDADSASVMVIVTSATTIGASFLLSLIDGRVGYHHILLGSGILIFITFPLMLVTKSAVTFIAFYAVAYVAFIVMNIAVPVVITRIVDYDMIGKFTGGRMFLHTLGNSLAGFVCIPLFETIGVFATLVVAGASLLFTGVAYYVYLKKNDKSISPTPADKGA